MSVIAEALRKVDPVVGVHTMPFHWERKNQDKPASRELVWFAAPVALISSASICLWLLLSQAPAEQGQRVAMSVDQSLTGTAEVVEVAQEKQVAEIERKVLSVTDGEVSLPVNSSETIEVKGANAEVLEMSLRPYSLTTKPAPKDELAKTEVELVSSQPIEKVDRSKARAAGAEVPIQKVASVQAERKEPKAKVARKAEKAALKSPITAVNEPSISVSTASTGWLEKSRQLEQSGNIKAAIAVVERHTGEQNFRGVGELYLARLFYRDRQYAKALYWYREQLILNPNHVKALVGLGVCHEALGNIGSATAVYRRIVQQQGMKSPLGELSIGRLAKLRGA